MRYTEAYILWASDTAGCQRMATQAVPDMIMVMGVTGSGKSYFINKLRKDAVLEGSGLNSGK